MTDQSAILLCADGAHDSLELQTFAETLGDHLDRPVSAVPVTAGIDDIAEMLRSLSESGSRQVVCLPATFHASTRLKAVLPDAISRFTETAPGASAVMGRDIGIDPLVLRAGEQRIRDAFPDVDQLAARALLLVVAPGGEVDANSDAAKFMRLMWEGMGFAWAELCYATGSFPGVEASFERACTLGFERVVCLPYALFESDVAEAVAYLEKEDCVVAKPVGLAEPIASIFSQRIAEASAGGDASAMNCQLCSFREQVLGDGHAHHHDHDHHHHSSD